MPSAVSLGRRKVSLDQPSRWVFNRMAEFYAARPPYPAALVDALVDLAGPVGRRVGDLGAGIGHLALPLAARGFDVVAIEAAQAMLDQLRASAAERGIALRALHAAAEQLPLEPACLDLVVVADALHFLDTELTARQIARVLAPGGALALVTCKFADTPFMRGVVRLHRGGGPSPAARAHAIHRSPVGLDRGSAHERAAISRRDARRSRDPRTHPAFDLVHRPGDEPGPVRRLPRARPCPAGGAGLGTNLRAPIRSARGGAGRALTGQSPAANLAGARYP